MQTIDFLRTVENVLGRDLLASEARLAAEMYEADACDDDPVYVAQYVTGYAFDNKTTMQNHTTSK
jgi:hypothetical protein